MQHEGLVDSISLEHQCQLLGYAGAASNDNAASVSRSAGLGLTGVGILQKEAHVRRAEPRMRDAIGVVVAVPLAIRTAPCVASWRYARKFGGWIS